MAAEIKKMAHCRSVKEYVAWASRVQFFLMIRDVWLQFHFPKLIEFPNCITSFVGIFETYQPPSQAITDVVSAAALENLAGEGRTRTREIIDEIEKFDWWKSRLLSGTVLFGDRLIRWLSFLPVNPTVVLINRITGLFPRSEFLYRGFRGPVYTIQLHF